MVKLEEPVVRSTIAFELPERDLLVEGIAHDPKSGAFFFSSVRQRKVLRRAADGKWETLAAFGEGATSPLGIAFDPGRSRLWLATAGLPQGGANAAALNRGNLMALDLANPGAVKALAFGALEDGHSTNDLALAADGAVWFSDPGGQAVGRLDAEGRLARFGEGKGMRSPGGVALSADGKRLYVADWTNGLATIDIATGAFAWLRPPAGATALGIDGLVRDGDSLLAIQNGVRPPRVTRFRLSADGLALAGAEILERAVPEWDEPTLGLVVDGALVYVAASQWPRYGEDGKPNADLSTLPLPSVRRLQLR
jgi:sugar lactone lactonase YvrE